MGKLESMFDELSKKAIEDEQKELEAANDIAEEVIEEVTEETVEDAVEETTDEVEEEDAVEKTTDEAEEEEVVLLTTEEEEGDDSTVEKEEINEDSFLKFASEKLGRNIKSLEDLEVKSEDVDISEQVKVINDYVKETGRTVNDWFILNSLNTENMDNEQLVKTDMRLKYPELTESQINRRFDKKYKLDEELNDADDVEDAKIELAIDANSAKATIAKFSEKYKAPIGKSSEEISAERTAELDKVKRAYIKDMEVAVDKIETFSFDVDGATVKYKPSKEDINKIKTANKNLETFFDGFKNEDGSFDFERLSLAMHFGKKENVAKLIKAVKGRYVSEGKDSEIKKRKNTKLPSTSPDDTPENAENSQIRQTFKETMLEELGVRKRTKIRF